MKLREIKLLAAGIVVTSLVTTNFIIPAVLDDVPALRVTAVSKPTPIDGEAASKPVGPQQSGYGTGQTALVIPDPVRVLTPAEARARAVAMRAHADRALAENDELPSQTGVDTATGTLKCVAGCE